MAILNVKLPTNLTEYPNSFKRQGSFPLEAYSVFYAITDAEGAVTTSALDAAKDYAKNNPIAYVGQILAVVTVTDGVSEVDVYKIENANGDLVPVGNTEDVEAAIKALEDYIGKIPTTSDAKTIIEYIDKKTEGIATSDSLAQLQKDVDAIESTVGNDESGLVKDVADIHAKMGEVADGKTIIGLIAEVEGKIPTVPTDISAFNNDAKYQTDTQVQATVSAAISEINHAVFQKVDSVPSVEDAEANVLYLVPNGDKMDIYAKIGEEVVLIDDTDADLSGYAKTADLEEFINKSHEHTFTDEDVNDAIAKKHEHTNATVLDSITSEKVNAWDNAEKNVINSVDETQFDIDDDRKLTLLDIAMSKVTGLNDALEDKASKATTLEGYGITDAYTKTETEARLKEVIDGLSDTSETAASVAQALETYKTSNDQRVGEVETKLDTVQDGAEVNILEAIKINGVEQEITDKAVNIAIATDTILGVVMGSDAENKVSVAEDGTMEVNSINVNKLTQTDGETLVLDGGSAAV